MGLCVECRRKRHRQYYGIRLDESRYVEADPWIDSQFEFNPEGDTLVVTEKATRIIDTYTVMSTVSRRAGLSSFKRCHPVLIFVQYTGVLIVSEALGGVANASAVSSYAFRNGR